MIREIFLDMLQPEALKKQLGECYPGIAENEAAQLATSFRAMMFGSRDEFKQRQREYTQLSKEIRNAIKARETGKKRK